MKLSDALKLEWLKRAKVVAGANALECTVCWVSVVDVPYPLPWVRTGQSM
jgi:purine catabolism regulator